MVVLEVGGRSSVISIAKGAQLIFRGAAHLSNNFSINLNSGAEVRIGDNFYSNYNFLLSCSSRVSFGKDCLVGWDVQIIDSDGHKIGTQFGKLEDVPKPIEIGNHSWLCSGAAILKGSFLKEGSIVALNATLSSKIEQDHVLVAGIPAKVIKRNIDWRH